jgi:predicted SAM-dependent methyltransferase
MKVHLGCGYRRLEGYVHVDSRAEVNPDYVADVGHLPFEDGSVSLLYACHVLEHVRRRAVEGVIEEWHRVLLKPGGVLRIAVPNFRVVAERYVGGVHLERLWGLLHGRQDYEENLHYCTYDYETLAKLLGQRGFFKIHIWDPKQVFPLGYDDYSMAELDGLHVSLNVEATAK